MVFGLECVLRSTSGQEGSTEWKEFSFHRGAQRWINSMDCDEGEHNHFQLTANYVDFGMTFMVKISLLSSFVWKSKKKIKNAIL